MECAAHSPLCKGPVYNRLFIWYDVELHNITIPLCMYHFVRSLRGGAVPELNGSTQEKAIHSVISMLIDRCSCSMYATDHCPKCEGPLCPICIHFKRYACCNRFSARNSTPSS